MNTTLITHKLCSSVRKHTVPPPEGASLHGENRGLRRIKSRVAAHPQEGIAHTAVQNWFVRSSDKDGQRFNNGETKMEIKGKVFCFFEQSGTFKNEFIKLGMPAVDIDIQNNFGQTDHVVDLFDQIEREYDKTRQDNFRHYWAGRPHHRIFSVHLFHWFHQPLLLST